MTPFLRRAFVPLVLFGWLAAGLPARALAPEVRDEGGFFSAAAVRQANEVLREIQKKHKIDLLVETFRTPPAARQKEIRDAKGKSQTLGKLFQDWATDRTRTTGVEGIYLLLCKDPAFLVVEVHQETRRKAFTAADRDELRGKVMVPKLNKNDNDQALLDGVRFVRDRLDKNLAAATPPVPTAPRTTPTALPAPTADEVNDRADFFSPSAQEKANDTLRDIKQLKQHVTVETFERMPPERRPANNDASEVSKAFYTWLQERMQASKVDGVHILVTRDPKHLQIDVGLETQKKAFTLADRDELFKRIRSDFSNADYDKGLLNAVGFIQTKMRERLKPAASVAAKPAPAPTPQVPVPTAKKTDTPPAKASEDKVAEAVEEENRKGPRQSGGIMGGRGADLVSVMKNQPMPPPPAAASASSFNWMWLVWAGVILVGVWIFVGLIRSLSGSPNRAAQQAGGPYAAGRGGPPPLPGAAGYQAGPPPLPGAGGYQGGYPAGGYPAGGYAAGPPPSRGGGFMTGMLGGMFGAAAGSWIYDKFARPSHPGGGWGTAHGNEPPRPAERSTGYGSAGGDYGEPGSAGGTFGSAGGEYGEPAQPEGSYGSAGGDYGTPAEEAGNYGSAGGDFGESADTGGGGSYGTDEPAADAGAGGDFGSSGADYGDSGGSYGDSGGTDAGGDFGGGGSGGGDSGGGGDGGGGGDF